MEAEEVSCRTWHERRTSIIRSSSGQRRKDIEGRSSTSGCVRSLHIGQAQTDLSLQRELDKRGYIYKSSYAGWYAVSDETYVPEDAVGEVIDPKSGEKYMVRLAHAFLFPLLT